MTYDKVMSMPGGRNYAINLSTRKECMWNWLWHGAVKSGTDRGRNYKIRIGGGSTVA